MFCANTGRLITALDATLPPPGPRSKSIKRGRTGGTESWSENKAAPVYPCWTCTSPQLRPSERKWANDPFEAFKPEERQHIVEYTRIWEFLPEQPHSYIFQISEVQCFTVNGSPSMSPVLYNGLIPKSSLYVKIQKKKGFVTKQSDIGWCTGNDVS